MAKWRNGRRAELSARFLNECEFESHLGHHGKHLTAREYLEFFQWDLLEDERYQDCLDSTIASLNK